VVAEDRHLTAAVAAPAVFVSITIAWSGRIRMLFTIVVVAIRTTTLAAKAATAVAMLTPFSTF
jgi:hypothetical protein